MNQESAFFKPLEGKSDEPEGKQCLLESEDEIESSES